MKNPNAVVGTGSGLSGGAIIVYLASRFGVHLDAYAGGVLFVVISGAVLWIGRIPAAGGVAGIWHRFIHGNTPPAA